MNVVCMYTHMYVRIFPRGETCHQLHIYIASTYIHESEFVPALW